MDLDGSRESESMSMVIDDGAVSRRHPHHCDSVGLNSPGPSGGRTPFDFHPQIVGSVQTSIHSLPSHPSPGCERLPGSHGSLKLMIPSSPYSPVNHLGETGVIYQNHGVARQQRDSLPSLKPSVQEVPPPKRKHSHGSPHTHITDDNHTRDDDAFTDGANSQSSRRIRPRLRKRPLQDREFSPLLYMSPSRERDLPVEEETVLAFHYPPNMTDPSCSIQRCFHPGNPREHDPRMLESSSSTKVDDLEDRKERERSDSADSFAQVALASTVGTHKHGRLSTLQDFWLPRPFEETEQPGPSMGSIKVHERGLEAPPSFFQTNDGRTGGLPGTSRDPAGFDSESPTGTILGHHIRAPNREHGVHACSPRSSMLPLEPNSTNFFDKPICDSPDEIDSDEDSRMGSHTLSYPRSSSG